MQTGTFNSNSKHSSFPFYTLEHLYMQIANEHGSRPGRQDHPGEDDMVRTDFQKALLKTQLEIQEQTFQTISQEIHDNIGQALTLIKINLTLINVEKSETAKKQVQETRSLVTKVIQDIRALSKILNTDFIKEIGLVNAMQQQLGLIKKTGLYKTSFTVEGSQSKFELDRELVLFRVFQELINNVVKHAEATKIAVSISYQQEKLTITIKDNGKGLDKQHLKLSNAKGMGLRNVQNRIKLINGKIDFYSQPQKGTTVVIELI